MATTTTITTTSTPTTIIRFQGHDILLCQVTRI